VFLWIILASGGGILSFEEQVIKIAAISTTNCTTKRLKRTVLIGKIEELISLL
jgi:hypothetical protein